jgi:glycosyl transferase family 2
MRGTHEGAIVSQASSNVFWPRVSVVVPTLNEARNLPYVFSRLPAGVHEVIVVDGHSVDDTITVARQLCPDVRIVQQTRRGKGNALACGFEAATGDVIAMIDADGSADPSEIPKFVQALLSGADFAKGTRFAGGGGSSDITRLRRLGNRLLGAVVNLYYGTHYTDLCYGFNVFWQKHVPVLGLDITSPALRKRDGQLWGDGFEIETLIHMRVAEEGLCVAEVPSFEHPRIHGVSNLDAFSDGLRVLTTILVERRRARRRRRFPRDAPGHEPQQSRTVALSTSRRPSCACLTCCTPSPVPAYTGQDHGLSGHGPHCRPQFHPAGATVGLDRWPPRNCRPT